MPTSTTTHILNHPIFSFKLVNADQKMPFLFSMFLFGSFSPSKRLRHHVALVSYPYPPFLLSTA